MPPEFWLLLGVFAGGLIGYCIGATIREERASIPPPPPRPAIRILPDVNVRPFTDPPPAVGYNDLD